MLVVGKTVEVDEVVLESVHVGAMVQCTDPVSVAFGRKWYCDQSSSVGIVSVSGKQIALEVEKT